jgi:hypothetical protein
MTVVFCIITLFGGFIIFLMKLVERPNIARMTMAMAAMTGIHILFVWVLACFDRRRAPDYVWEDWKLREE